MASVNRCIFIGNVTRDIELKYLPSGDALANFSIACNESYKDKQGNKQEKVEYVRLSMFGKLAEIAGEYLKKGSSVYVEGRLQTREWDDKEGNKRQTTEIICDRMQMLGGRPDARQPSVQNEPKNEQSNGFDDFNDDINF